MANQTMGIIKKTFAILNKSDLVSLCKALIRPHLEYGNVIWYPRYKRQSVTFEKVQGRAKKLVNEIYNFEDRLKHLDLPTLKMSRMRGDHIQTYQEMSPDSGFTIIKNFRYSDNNKTRYKAFKISIQYCKTKLRKMALI